VKGAARLLLALALGAGIALALVYREHLDAAALTDWVAAAGAAGPLAWPRPSPARVPRRPSS
jgi:hypothetical protein